MWSTSTALSPSSSLAPSSSQTATSSSSQTATGSSNQTPTPSSSSMTLDFSSPSSSQTSMASSSETTTSSSSSTPTPPTSLMATPTSSQTCTLSSPQQWSLTGTATFLSDVAAPPLQLTPPESDQVGGAWLSSPVNVSDDFTFTFTFAISDSPGGADGLTFVMHNDPRGANSLGGHGSGLGYSGIQNSVGVRFDTWNNGHMSSIGLITGGYLDSDYAGIESYFDWSSGHDFFCSANVFAERSHLNLACDGDRRQPLTFGASYIFLFY